ncbi:MAG: SgcJ/EcaC family oxidoreductase [Anaerolineae bacterium]|nr:SgcJ/EcaC family oxidoreductase [Anaerolineae bacterium]
MNSQNHVADLYHQLLNAWNRQNAADFAALFDAVAIVIGFDGSQMNGRAEIESTLSQIFADHPTAIYVAKIRDIRLLTPEVAVLHAVVGMVPRGQHELNPKVNAHQTLVAVQSAGQWRIAQFQNTPAQFHGRPDLAEALTNELRELLSTVLPINY